MSELEMNLHDLLKEIAKEQNYTDGHIDIQEISSGSANYTGVLYVATISAPPKEDIKLFAKVANIGDTLREKTMNNIYEVERFFYTELSITFKNLYNKNEVPEEDRLYIPKYYGHRSIKHKETLVLENLSAKGFENFDRLKSYDWEYASRSVEELAKFHALGLAYREENREELEIIGKTLLLDMYADENITSVFLRQAINMGTQMIKKEYRSKMKKYFDENNLLDVVAKLWKPKEGGFLIHSDYKPNNLMHRNKAGKLEIVPIDYQTLHLGTLAADLMYFIWTGSDSHFRQHHYQQLLEHYYEKLTMALQNLQLNISDVYPRKVFEQELKDTQTLGLFVGLGMMTLLTVDPDSAPKLDDFEDIIMKPNQLALDRMNGIVEDYISWGII